MDPIAAFEISLEGLFIDGDGLEQHCAMRLEQPVDRAEVIVIVTEANRLKHLDADDFVE